MLLAIRDTTQLTDERDANRAVLAATADGLVLPGVGAFHEGMEQLGTLKDTVIKSTRDVPLLGICLGMQLFSRFSEEGNVQGMNWIKARTEKFKLEE